MGGKKKSPLGKHHGSNCRQSLSMAAKISRWKLEEKKDICISPQIFVNYKESNFAVEKPSTQHLNLQTEIKNDENIQILNNY